MNSNILLLVLLGFSKEYCHTKMSNLNDKSVSLLDDNNSAQSEHENSLVSDVEKINKPLLNEENSLSDEDPDVVELQNLIGIFTSTEFHDYLNSYLFIDFGEFLLRAIVEST